MSGGVWICRSIVRQLYLTQYGTDENERSRFYMVEVCNREQNMVSKREGR